MGHLIPFHFPSTPMNLVNCYDPCRLFYLLFLYVFQIGTQQRTGEHIKITGLLLHILLISFQECLLLLGFSQVFCCLQQTYNETLRIPKSEFSTSHVCFPLCHQMEYKQFFFVFLSESMIVFNQDLHFYLPWMLLTELIMHLPTLRSVIQSARNMIAIC